MPDSVETALRYWLKSKARSTSLAGRVVFLRTALEALFLDRSNRAELAFRLATNGAWYTGRNPTERRQRFDTLKEVYGDASGAAHSGSIRKTAEKLLTKGHLQAGYPQATPVQTGPGVGKRCLRSPTPRTEAVSCCAAGPPASVSGYGTVCVALLW